MRTIALTLLTLILNFKRGKQQKTVKDSVYTGSYIYFENIDSKGKNNLFDLNVEITKRLTKIGTTLENALPKNFKTLILSFKFKPRTITEEVFEIKMKETLNGAKGPIITKVKVSDLTEIPIKSYINTDSIRFRHALITIGRELEYTPGGKEYYKVNTYYPESELDLPWKNKEMIKKSDLKVIKSEGINLRNLAITFKYDDPFLKNIKIFFDSYIGVSVDETFLTSFLETPTVPFLYIPFNFTLPDKDKDNIQQLIDEISGNPVQPNGWKINHRNKITYGDYLSLTMKGSDNKIEIRSFDIDIPKTISKIEDKKNEDKKDEEKEVTRRLDLRDNSFYVSFWFMINMEKNYKTEDFKENKNSVFHLVNFTLNTMDSEKNGKSKPDHMITVCYENVADEKQKEVQPFPVYLEFSLNPESKNKKRIKLGTKNVNNPFNENHKLTNKKWYFLMARISKTNISGDGKINFDLLISNPREKESIQLIYPGIDDDFITKDFENAFKFIKFSPIGNIAELRITKGGFDIRNDHNSLFQSGLRVDYCQFGYNYRRIKANLIEGQVRYIFETKKDCYNCMSVSTDPSLHGKDFVKKEDKEERPVILEGAEEIPLIWDGNQCSISCPFGFRENYRSMRCDNCFLKPCTPKKDLVNAETVFLKENDSKDEKKKKITYKQSAICGDDIVEYDKGEECDGAPEGCKQDCKAEDGYVCYSPLLGNSRCQKCEDEEIRKLCEKLYKSVEKNFRDQMILQRCIKNCEYGVGFYPIKGFIRTSWGIQTYKNQEGEEKLCFLANLNIRERGKIIENRNSKGGAINSFLAPDISEYCKTQCKLEYQEDLDMCFGFHRSLGYKKEGMGESVMIRAASILSTFFAVTVLTLAVLSLLFLAPAGNIHLFFMMIDLLQLYHIWGLRAPKSFEKKVLLSNLRFVSFDWFYGWLKKTIMGEVFEFRKYHILNYDEIESVSDVNFKQDDNFISQWEDFMQYKKTGYFILDAANITEIYIYYLFVCILLSFALQIFKRFLDRRNVFRVIYTNFCRYFISRKFLFRIFNESYVYLFLYGLYMELNIDFPKKKSTDAILINYPHVIINKIFQRVVLCCIGIGFPTYLIARLTIYGKGEQVDEDLNFMVSGCKEKAYSGRVLPVFVIIRKILVVLYVLPCFSGMSLGLSLLIIATQVIILSLLINGLPFKERNVNCIAVTSNLIFFITSFIFFINSIIQNFLQLTYITSEDYSIRPDLNFQSSYTNFDDIVNNVLTMITVGVIIMMFTCGIFNQVFLQIKINKEFYGSIFSGRSKNKKNNSDDDDDDDELGIDKVFELVAI